MRPMACHSTTLLRADEDLLRAREGLVGEIQQLPPMYSAIKVRLLGGREGSGGCRGSVLAPSL